MTRTAYTPHGQLRGADNVAVDRGWLGQVEDRVDGATGTGLTYLNARHYDPVSMRFISPDPLMNPADPATLDPYRYADNNPVVFTDATGLYSSACISSTGSAKAKCESLASNYKPVGSATPFTPGTPDGGGVQSLPKPKNPGHLEKSSPPASIFDYGGNPPALGGHSPNTGYLCPGHPGWQPGGGMYGGDATKAQTWKALGIGAAAMFAVGLCEWAAAECLALVGVDATGFGLRTRVVAAETGAGLEAGLAGRSLPVLEIDASRMPSIAANIRAAQEAGQPVVLTRTTDGSLIAANRAAACRGFCGVGSPEEYPFASTLEGGAQSTVRGVPISEQRVQGGCVGKPLSPERDPGR